MDKRTTLALLLMAALLTVYSAVFLRGPEPVRQADQKAEAPAPATAKPAEAPAPPAATPSPKAAPSVPERTVTIETPLYRATIGSMGGQVKSWDLHFRGEKAMVLPGTIDNLGLAVLRPGQPPSAIAFTPSVETIKLDDAHPTGELRLVGEDGL